MPGHAVGMLGGEGDRDEIRIARDRRRPNEPRLWGYYPHMRRRQREVEENGAHRAGSRLGGSRSTRLRFRR